MHIFFKNKHYIMSSFYKQLSLYKIFGFKNKYMYTRNLKKSIVKSKATGCRCKLTNFHQLFFPHPSRCKDNAGKFLKPGDFPPMNIREFVNQSKFENPSNYPPAVQINVQFCTTTSRHRKLFWCKTIFFHLGCAKLTLLHCLVHNI